MSGAATPPVAAGKEPGRRRHLVTGLVSWGLWGYLLLGLLVYLGIALFAGTVPERDARGWDGFSRVLLVISGLTGLLTLAVRWVAFRRGLRWKDARGVRGMLYSLYLGGSLLLWVLSSSVGVYALVLRFLGAGGTVFAVFWGISLALLVFHCPWFLERTPLGRHLLTEEEGGH